MHYVDYRLSKILSDIRIEEARSRNRRQSSPARQPVKQKIGLWLIRQGESLADHEPRAAA